jgi:prepilin-type N-terminal cleavage/methylation domain-containing protein/prepilin-type processing-associated H-X9-DG protein
MNIIVSDLVKRDASPAPRHGFSLVELLVLIAILAILAGLLLPALAKAKARAQGIACLNNHKQLMLAWMMYADDHAGQLVANHAGPKNKGPEPGVTNWVAGWLDWTTSPDNINQEFLTDPKFCLLAPYLGKAAQVFKCPADSYLSPRQHQAGWNSRVRSVSMNACVGEGIEKAQTVALPRIYRKLTNLNRPGPAMLWITLDEHPDSIDDACFLVNVQRADWPSLPAGFHTGACGFGFADGHAEIKRWSDLSSRAQQIRFEDYLEASGIFSGAANDHAWLKERTCDSTGK